MWPAQCAGAAVSSGAGLTSIIKGVTRAWRPHHVCLLLQLGVNGCNAPCSATQRMTGCRDCQCAHYTAGWPCSRACAWQQKCMTSMHGGLHFIQQADACCSPCAHCAAT